MIKVGINGFGRIGRLALRIIMNKFRDKILPVAINTSGKIDTKSWTHLFTWDSIYGKYKGDVSSQGNNMTIDGINISVYGEKDPAKIPWGKWGTQLVIESTGVFRTLDKISLHLRDTVEKVILSAPPKDEDIPIYVIGVNNEGINKRIISAASCTTNCLAPIIKVVDQEFGVKKALMTTIHAYTSDQELLDGSHKDLRRARAAALNIVPTTTGAADSVGKIFPSVSGKFTGLSIRVPVAVGSLVDLVFLSSKEVSKESINSALETASKTYLKGILDVTNEPLVSTDIIGSSASAIVDLSLTQVIDKDLVKIIAWYDNEWGYTNRLVEEVVLATGS